MKSTESKTNLFWKKIKWQIPKTNTNNYHEINFKNIDTNPTGLVFFFTTIIAPLFLSLLNFLIWKDNSSNDYILFVQSILTWIIIGVGFYVIQKQIGKDEMFRNGAMAFYFFYYIPNAVALIFSLVLSLLGISEYSTTLLLTFSIIGDLVPLIMCFVMMPIFKNKMINTLKNDWKIFLIAITAFIFLTFILSSLFSEIQHIITPNSNSNNQNDLTDLDSWWDKILLFILTIMVAPFIEEMATRHGIFALSSNRWFAFFSSILFFAGMHITSSNDWTHIIGYLGGSIALTTCFMIARDNVTYSIFTHMGINLISYILILAVPGQN
ncbi:lysostaphin resistance A-like protein [Spiroplasma endosymbiont of Amphibalanus improvisus]|uniref:CPBP family intramembrane glutamic endopeptidase n=1 Tax=Spiroplasma endosymbiont of Amphibalanus improvisus TaxID=3066327 RepID=UPI00313E7345